MSGVSRLVLAENKGLEVPTNEDLKEEGVASKKESSEKVGEEKK